VAIDHGSEINGMTTNERLSHFGLLKQFDLAARTRNRSKMIAALSDAMVDDPERVADAVLARPASYGY
jgi:hypothetical protein